MKTIKRKCVIVSVLFAMLCIAQTASAWYAPGLQRWINRDPIEEEGGVNLYAFAGNEPTEFIDSWGTQISAPIEQPHDPPLPSYPTSPPTTPSGPIFPSHPASSDANKSQTGSTTTGNAPPACPTGNCDTPGATTPKRPAGKERKNCPGLGTIEVNCQGWNECQYHSQPLNRPTVYRWQPKRDCPCPSSPTTSPSPAPRPNPSPSTNPPSKN